MEVEEEILKIKVSCFHERNIQKQFLQPIMTGVLVPKWYAGFFRQFRAKFRDLVIKLVATSWQLPLGSIILRDGEVPSQKELSSFFEELYTSKVPRQKELSSLNEEIFPNPDHT